MIRQRPSFRHRLADFQFIFSTAMKNKTDFRLTDSRLSILYLSVQWVACYPCLDLSPNHWKPTLFSHITKSSSSRWRSWSYSGAVRRLSTTDAMVAKHQLRTGVIDAPSGISCRCAEHLLTSLLQTPQPRARVWRGVGGGVGSGVGVSPSCDSMLICHPIATRMFMLSISFLQKTCP